MSLTVGVREGLREEHAKERRLVVPRNNLMEHDAAQVRSRAANYLDIILLLQPNHIGHLCW